MTDDEQRIRELFTSWHSASAAGNLSKLLGLMDEDVVFLIAGQPPMRGREAFASTFQALLQQHSLQSTGKIQELQVSGELAYLWSHLSVTITPLQGGPPNLRSGYTLTVLHKKPDGSWVLFRDANMLTQAKE